MGRVHPTPSSPGDPVAEVFDAIAQARRRAPGTGLACRVAVRSRTGQLLATFVLDNAPQLQAFEERMRPLGYHMAADAVAGTPRYDFALDRRAANQALHAPCRRRSDAGRPIAH